MYNTANKGPTKYPIVIRKDKLSPIDWVAR